MSDPNEKAADKSLATSTEERKESFRAQSSKEITEQIAADIASTTPGLDSLGNRFAPKDRCCSDVAPTDFEGDIGELPVFAKMRIDCGKDAMGRQRPLEALGFFEEASRLMKDQNPCYLYLQATSLEALGNLDLAEEKISEAIRLGPEDLGKYYFCRGRIRLANHKRKAAIEDFNQSIQFIESNQGHEFAGFKNEPEMQRALADVYFHRGKAFQLSGELLAALDDFSHCIDIVDDYSEAYVCRARVQDCQGRYDEAVKDLDKALDTIKDFEDARVETRDYRFRRGCVYLNWRKYQKAIVDLDFVIEPMTRTHGIGALDSLSIDAMFYRGVARLENGDFDLAAEDFQLVLQRDPTYALAYRNLGVTHARKDQHDKAKERYLEAMEHQPDFAAAYYKRALARLNTDPESAIEDLSEAIHHNGDMTDAYYYRALLRRQIPTKRDLAISDFKRAILLKNDHVYAMYHLGQTYKMKGQFNDAIKQFSQIISRFPGKAFAYRARAVVHREMGDHERFAEDLSRAKELES